MANGSKNLNYRIILEKDIDEAGAVTYSAHCPTLAVFDYGQTIEEALSSIKDGILGVIDFLSERGEEIPTDHPETGFVAFTQVEIPANRRHLVYA